MVTRAEGADMTRSAAAVLGGCLVLLLTSPAADANYFLAGKDLYKMCQGYRHDKAECLGYIMGVVDHLEAMRGIQKKPPCVKAGVEADKVRDVVFQYMHDNPQERDQAAWSSGVVAV